MIVLFVKIFKSQWKRDHFVTLSEKISIYPRKTKEKKCTVLLLSPRSWVKQSSSAGRCKPSLLNRTHALSVEAQLGFEKNLREWEGRTFRVAERRFAKWRRLKAAAALAWAWAAWCWSPTRSSTSPPTHAPAPFDPSQSPTRNDTVRLFSTSELTPEPYFPSPPRTPTTATTPFCASSRSWEAFRSATPPSSPSR